MTQRYLVFECGAVKGLGDILISILNLAYYAHRWDRVLALDMRNFQYLKPESHDQFFQNFLLEAPAGLSITTDLGLIDNLYPQGSYRLITGKEDISIDRNFGEEVVVAGQTFACDHLYTPARKSDPPEFLIQLRGKLSGEIERNLARYDWDNYVGVHFRHGNGEFLADRFDSIRSDDYEKDCAILWDEYTGIVNEVLSIEGNDNSRVFIASDNRTFVDELKSKLKGAFSLASEVPDSPYQEHLKTNNQNPDILRDAALDIWALSNCEHLVCGESLFSEFAFLNSTALLHEKLHHVSLFSFEHQLETADPADLVTAIRKAVARAPLNIKLRRKLARALNRAGKFDEAGEVKNEINYLSEHRRFRPVFVNILIQHKQYERAIRAIESANQSWPDRASRQALLSRLKKQARQTSS